MNKTIKNIGCSILATVMGCSSISIPLFASEEDHPTEKTETVYTVIDANGNVEDTIVSSWLHDEDGIQSIQETLDLENVENIKTDEKPTVKGKEYTWNVKGNDVYYQGDTKKDLPISLSIEYKLDGKTIAPKDLVGKSGHLEMLIHFTNNISKKVMANGKEVTIHPSYIAGGLMDLNTDVFSNVKCKQGKIVNDGKNEILAFATIPGLAQTLDEAGLSTVAKKVDLSDTITINADVKDYQETEIMMGATNEMDAEDIEGIDSVSDLTGGINELVSASEQINKGTHQLSDGTGELKAGIQPLTQAGPKIEELSNGTAKLYDGSKQLNTGIEEYTNGVAKVNTGAGQLAQGTDQLRAGMQPLAQVGPQLNQLGNGVSQLYDGSKKLHIGIEEYTNGVAKVNTGAGQLAQGTDQLKEGMKPLESAYPQIDQLIEGSSQLDENAVTSVFLVK